MMTVTAHAPDAVPDVAVVSVTLSSDIVRAYQVDRLSKQTLTPEICKRGKTMKTALRKSLIAAGGLNLTLINARRFR